MGWWGKSDDPKPEQPKETPLKEKIDNAIQPVKEKLPKPVPQIIEKAEPKGSLFEDISDG